MTVLILTRDLDPSADQIVTALRERGVPVFRVNTRWFPTGLRLTARIRGGRWAGTLATDQRTLDLEQIRAVWYRAPEAFAMPETLNAAEAAHARVEAKYGLGGVLASLPGRWCNHPSRAADAAYKPVQLARAAQCGLQVPETLIGNEAGPVHEFAAGGVLVSKLVGGMALDEDGVRKNVFTHRVSEAELADLRGIEHTAHLFQRWVPKHVEARVIVIGDQVTAAEITAHSAAGYVDYRADYPALSYRLIAPREDVVTGIRQLMHQLGLLYAALDFVITPDGDWVFLEINPSGQYGWIEAATGAPLTSQLADLLSGATP
jgi:ATP-grasp ribosomal peptide maturase